MENPELAEFISLSAKLNPTHHDDNTTNNDRIISDMDYFIKTLSNIHGKEARPDLIGSIITHYASKWLPELSTNSPEKCHIESSNSPEMSVTSSLTKKRFFIETLVGILPPEKDSVHCNFLLRLLRVANRVRVEPVYLNELEKRVSWQLDQASLKELMIPSFSHTSTTLFDVELLIRLVRRFVSVEEAARSGAAVMKVAKLVDCYLAEAAVDHCLSLDDFVALATSLPSHARSIDDGLYRAIDTYLKAHPTLSKKDRKTLCSLMDSRKLSQEASFHATQNERLPVRAVIQVLLSEQTKLINKHIIEWSGSLSGARSPAMGLEHSARCFSKRETSIQQIEIKRLKEDVLRLQSQCMAMERQMERMMEKKSSRYFSWRKFSVFKGNRIGEVVEDDRSERVEVVGMKTPVEMRTRLLKGRTPNRRKSLS